MNSKDTTLSFNIPIQCQLFNNPCIRVEGFFFIQWNVNFCKPTQFWKRPRRVQAKCSNWPVVKEKGTKWSSWTAISSLHISLESAAIEEIVAASSWSPVGISCFLSYSTLRATTSFLLSEGRWIKSRFSWKFASKLDWNVVIGYSKKKFNKIAKKHQGVSGLIWA